ncbi:MAG: prepilin peptidase CpaA [Yoonia sp.]|jgi:Flp pilus assembly protein protease CpaA
MMIFYIQYAVAAVLIGAALSDMRTGRIPNWFALIFVGLFAVMAVTSLDTAMIAWQLGFAAGTLVLGMALFQLLGFGAGAVKLLACAALFLPMDRSFALLALLLGSLFGLGLIVGIVNRIYRDDNSPWAFLKKPVMPLSLPICATGLAGMFWF